MIYLLWTVLNLALFLAFLFVCFKAAGYLRQQLGVFAAILFVFGSCSYINHTNESSLSNANKQFGTDSFTFVPDSVVDNVTFKNITPKLEKTPISTITLNIAYAKLKGSNNRVPVKAYSSLTGVAGSYNWEPSAAIVKATGKPGEYEYHVEGLMNWSLLGNKIYSQFKDYRGKVMLN